MVNSESFLEQPFFGASGGLRSRDQRFTRPLLYQAEPPRLVGYSGMLSRFDIFIGFELFTEFAPLIYQLENISKPAQEIGAH